MACKEVVPLFGQLAPSLDSVRAVLAWALGQEGCSTTDLASLCRQDVAVLLAWTWHEPNESELPALPHTCGPALQRNPCPRNVPQRWAWRFLTRWASWQPSARGDSSKPQWRQAVQLVHRAGETARYLADRLHSDPDRAEVAARLAGVGHVLHAAGLLPRRAVRDYWRQFAQEPGWPPWLAEVLATFDLPMAPSGRVPAGQRLLRIVQCAWQFSQTALPDDLRLPGPEWQQLLTSLGVEPTELLNLQPVAEMVSASQPGESLWPLMVEVAKEALRAQHFAGAAGRQARSWQHWGQAVQSRFDAELRERQLQSLAVFAAGAGHELGNPLAVISGYAEQLLRTEKQWERIEALQRILAQCRRMDSLIRDLMFYARPPEPKFRHCRLDRLLTQVAKELTPYASSKCVAIHCHSETHQPSLRADKSLLQKALDCLLRNAIEAAPVGGWVRCTLHTEPSHGLSVHIEDNGPGPDPAWQEHIFDPFFSGRSAGRGHGLGLCKVWRIAQLHGGQITWERTPQNTTRFILRLPQRPASKTS